LANARTLSEAADLLETGKSSFGRWAIADIFQEQGTAVLYGQSGTSKSFFAIKTALALCSGRPWFGKHVRQGSVVYLAAEDRPGVEARAVAAARRMEETALADLCLEFLTPPPIHSDAWRDDLPAALEAIQIRQERKITAVILDTLGAAFGGNSQDDAASMTVATDRAEAIAERLRCLFISVHHSGKDLERGMRGSQVLKDRSDTVLTLSKKNGSFAATIEKQRNGAVGASLAFQLAPVEVVFGSERIETCVVDELESLLPDTERPPDNSQLQLTRKLPNDTKIALEALKSLVAVGGEVRLSDWSMAARQAFGPRSDEALRAAFYGAKKRLVEDKTVRIEGDTVRFQT